MARRDTLPLVGVCSFDKSHEKFGRIGADEFLPTFVRLVTVTAMLSRGLPPLRRVYCYSCQKNIQARGIVGKATRERILSGPKKRGAPKGRPKDPNDPSKTVNRNTLINWKPRGPRGTPTHLKSTIPFLTFGSKNQTKMMPWERWSTMMSTST